MACKHMKRCSASLIFMEMQIRTVMSYHLTSIRVATINKKKPQNSKWGRREIKPFALLVGLQNSTPVVENTVVVPQKLKLELPYDLAIPFQDIYLKKLKTGSQGDIFCTFTVIAI